MTASDVQPQLRVALIEVEDAPDSADQRIRAAVGDRAAVLGPAPVRDRSRWLLQGADLLECIDGCMLLMVNDYEMNLILNKTNTRLLVRLFGTTDTAAWRGPITLYVENNVEYGGRVVGGIRVHQARAVNGHAQKAKSVAATPGFEVEPF